MLRLLTFLAFAGVLWPSLNMVEKAHAESSEVLDLVGITWIAEEIDGQAVLNRPESTLTFPSEEQIAGISGCNRYFGSVRIDGSTLEFGNTGGTRMACQPAIDDQERRFLDALSRVRGFTQEEDILNLLDEDGNSVMRLSRQKGE